VDIPRAAERPGPTYTRRLAVMVTPPTDDRLRALAAEQEVSVADVVRYAITKMFADED